MRSVTFHLLVGGNSAEDNLGKLTAVERAICDASFSSLACFKIDTAEAIPNNF